MTEITHVIFDFDGTIADSFHVFIDVAKELFDIDEALTDEFLEELRGLRRDEVMERLDITRLQALWSYREGRRMFTDRMDEVNVFEGMPDVLDALQHSYTLGVLTDNDEDVVKDFLASHDLPDFAFVMESSVFQSKTWSLQEVLRREGVEAEQIVYVGDQITDIESAHRAGCEAIGVDWGYNTGTLLESADPERLVSSPEELSSMIQSL